MSRLTRILTHQSYHNSTIIILICLFFFLYMLRDVETIPVTRQTLSFKNLGITCTDMQAGPFWAYQNWQDLNSAAYYSSTCPLNSNNSTVNSWNAWSKQCLISTYTESVLQELQDLSRRQQEVLENSRQIGIKTKLHIFYILKFMRTKHLTMWKQTFVDIVIIFNQLPQKPKSHKMWMTIQWDIPLCVAEKTLHNSSICSTWNFHSSQ